MSDHVVSRNGNTNLIGMGAKKYAGVFFFLKKSHVEVHYNHRMFADACLGGNVRRAFSTGKIHARIFARYAPQRPSAPAMDRADT